jgi:hypothetical protein
LVASCVFKYDVDEGAAYHQKNVGWKNKLEYLEKMEKCRVHDTNHEGFNHNSLNWSLHLLSVYIIKMSQGAMIAGVAMVAICCSVSSAAMLMMGGDEEKTPTGPGPSSPGPTGPLTSLTVGSAVQCEAGDPIDAPNQAVYRYVGDNTLRHYPNPTIATSWDPNWGSFTKIADCTGVTKGTTLPHKTVSDAEVGSAWQCEASDPIGAPNAAVYRYMGNDTFRHYPNPTIASSWDSNWTSFGKVPDCTGVIKGDPLPMKP